MRCILRRFGSLCIRTQSSSDTATISRKTLGIGILNIIKENYTKRTLTAPPRSLWLDLTRTLLVPHFDKKDLQEKRTNGANKFAEEKKTEASSSMSSSRRKLQTLNLSPLIWMPEIAVHSFDTHAHRVLRTGVRRKLKIRCPHLQAERRDTIVTRFRRHRVVAQGCSFFFACLRYVCFCFSGVLLLQTIWVDRVCTASTVSRMATLARCGVTMNEALE